MSAFFTLRYPKGGVELLIYVGINAVQLNGEGFIARIGQGQLLLEFDMDKIKAAGYSLETPVLITNHTDLKEIKNTNEAVVSNDVDLIKVEF